MDLDKSDIDKSKIIDFLERKEKIIKNYDDEDDYYNEPAKSYKIGRNDPCPCGSGKKYKKCCARVKPERPIEYYIDKLSVYLFNVYKSLEIDYNVHKENFEIAKKADRDYPVEPIISELAGLIAYQLGQYEQTVKFLTKDYNIVKEDMPTNAAFHLIDSLMEINEFKKAENLLNELLKYNESYELLLLMSELKFVLGETKKGYKYGLQSYEESDYNINILNTILKISVKNKLYKDSFSLIRKKYFELDEIEYDDENVLFLVEEMIDAVFLINNVEDKDINMYLKKLDLLIDIFDIIDTSKNLTNKDIKKLSNIIPKKYDISFFLVRLFYTLENYNWIVDNNDILLENTDNYSTILSSIIDSSFLSENYELIIDYLHDIIGFEFFKENDPENIFDFLKYYLISLYKTKDKEKMKRLINEMDMFFKDYIFDIISSVINNQENFEQFKIWEFIKSNYDNESFNKLYILNLQLSLLTMNLRYIEEEKIDKENVKLIERTLKEYEEYNNDSFIYHYSYWLLNKNNNVNYKYTLKEVINKEAIGKLSVIIKYLLIIKTDDPEIIINNPPDKKLLTRNSINFYKDIAKLKIGKIDNAIDLFSKYPEKADSILDIINDLFDEERITKLYSNLFQ